MVRDKGSKKLTTEDTLDTNHTLHQSLLRKREGIRLPAEDPQDHVDVLLVEGSRK
jgi:hypothetical protein